MVAGRYGSFGGEVAPNPSGVGNQVRMCALDMHRESVRTRVVCMFHATVSVTLIFVRIIPKLQRQRGTNGCGARFRSKLLGGEVNLTSRVWVCTSPS